MDMLECSVEDSPQNYKFPVKKLSGAFKQAEEEDLMATPEKEEFIESPVPPVEERERLFAEKAVERKEEGKPVSMKVYLRVRPIMEAAIVSTTAKATKEEEKARTSTIKVESDTSIVTQAPTLSKRAQYTKLEERNYTFTRVFGTESSQDDVYDDTVEPLMQKFMKGESCVLFAYGMTNAGKTHTIQGNKEDPGAMPKLINSCLDHISCENERESEDSDVQWELKISALEIYQDKVYDLLTTKERNSSHSELPKHSRRIDRPMKREALTLRDGHGRVEVLHLSHHKVSSAEQAVDLMDAASNRRSKSHTSLNSGSSRSHAVYSLSLNKVHGNITTRVSEFQLVDLAGAERGKRTQAGTQQAKEANQINVSLMQLWRCLDAMGSHNKDSKEVIPFRNSKLTHLLMPLLGTVGLSGVAMITCVNPKIDDYDETVSVLAHASLACNITEIPINRTATMNSGANGNGSVKNRNSSTNNPADNIRSHKRGKANSSSSSTTSTSTRARFSGRSTTSSSSTSTTGSHSSHETIQNKNNTAAAGSKRCSSLISIDEDSAPCHSQSHSEEDTELIKSLEEEIANLHEQNNDLLEEQGLRESEIREEVAEEMMQSSAHLLEEIQHLQAQIAQQASSSPHPTGGGNMSTCVAKSVMKAKQQQVDAVSEDFYNDLQDSVKELTVDNEELRTTKYAYEERIDAMVDEYTEMREELAKVKARAEQLEGAMESLEKENDGLRESLAAANANNAKTSTLTLTEKELVAKVTNSVSSQEEGEQEGDEEVDLLADDADEAIDDSITVACEEGDKSIIEAETEAETEESQEADEDEDEDGDGDESTVNAEESVEEVGDEPEVASEAEAEFEDEEQATVEEDDEQEEEEEEEEEDDMIIENMTVLELKSLCRLNGLKVGGTKAELIARIVSGVEVVQYQAMAAQANADAAAARAAATANEKNGAANALISAATAFEQRMKRDQRFNNNSNKGMKGEKSPLRTTNVNSPKQESSNNGISEKLSPKKAAGASKTPKKKTSDLENQATGGSIPTPRSTRSNRKTKQGSSIAPKSTSKRLRA